MNLKFYQNLASAMIEADRDNIALYQKIDVAHAGGNELPESIRSLPWMVEIKSTSVHDALAAARRALLSSFVEIDVLPPMPNEMTALAAEQLERALEFQFMQARKRSVVNPLACIVDNVLRYMSVAVQIIDNEFEYKKVTGNKKDAILRAGRYTWEVFDRKSVHAGWSSNVLERVLSVQELTIQQIVDKYEFDANGKPNKGVTRLVADSAEKKENKGKDLAEITTYLFDYVDYEERCIWTCDDPKGGGEGYTIYKGENKLKFIPWVFRSGDDPLVKAAVETNQLDNLNIMLSMRYALIAATVAQARTWSRTPTGEGVYVDHSNPDAQAQLAQGEEVGILPPSQTDPNIHTVIQTLENAISNTTSVSPILSSSASLGANMPYSTMSAMIQLALSSLVEIRQMVEAVIEDGLYRQICWVKYTDKPLTGRRVKKAGMYDETMNIGAAVVIDPGAVDAQWDISVTLKPNSPTDRQERMSYALNMAKQANLPRAWVLEAAGIEVDAKVSLAEWADEQVAIARVQAEVQKIMGEAQLALQQQVQAAQAQQQNAQVAPDQSMNETGSPNSGYPPPAMQNPNSTFETVTGETRTTGG